jgi:hypothetical protein
MQIDYYVQNIISYCTECDPEIERNLPFRLSETCDCNLYIRWICVRCRNQEEGEDTWYQVHFTEREAGHGGMSLEDYQSTRDVRRVVLVQDFYLVN